MLRSAWLVIALCSVARAERPRVETLRLVAHLMSAVHEGDCDVVRELVTRVQEVDANYYRDALATNPAIRACVSPPPVVDSARDVRRGPVIGVAVGVGIGAQIDGRFGVMVGGSFAIFGSLTAGGTFFVDSATDYKLAAVGMRMWIPYVEHLFVDVRGGVGTVYQGECDFDITRACTKHGFGVFAGLGVELTHNEYFRLEFHHDFAYVGGAGGMVVGLGVSLY